MTCAEFIEKFRSTICREDMQNGGNNVWMHFEGRVPEVTNECVRELRSMSGMEGLRISVECEKPDRKALDHAARLADVVFYSKLWAEVRISGVLEGLGFMLMMDRICMEIRILCRFCNSRFAGWSIRDRGWFILHAHGQSLMKPTSV
jgi:hypothetical protein